MHVKLWSLALEVWNFACIFFLPFENFFVSCPRKFLANGRNPRPNIAAAPAYHHGHEVKMVPNCKKMLPEQKNHLSFEFIILELFDCFTSLRVAGCLSAALKRQPNEAGNKYSELIHILSLQKKYHQYMYLQKWSYESNSKISC